MKDEMVTLFPGAKPFKPMKYIPGTNIPFSEDPWQMSPEEIAYWLEDIPPQELEEYRKAGQSDLYTAQIERCFG